MRVVSMVPSWTETLIRAGIDVVGRTRYCIHPSEKVSSIPIVGGTKEVDWDLVIELNPDIVLLDKEENPLEMAQECPLPFLATHVSSLSQLQKELEILGDYFRNPYLIELAIDCYDILQSPKRRWTAEKIPGLIEHLPKSAIKTDSTEKQFDKQVIYVIWKKPWMTITRETYIGSVLESLGAQLVIIETGEKYPVFEVKNYKDCFFLFSSEPYPFHKKINELSKLELSGAIVNGESYSWFGSRSLDFLKSLGH